MCEQPESDPARILKLEGSQATGSAEEIASLRQQLTTAIQARQEAERARDEALYNEMKSANQLAAAEQEREDAISESVAECARDYENTLYVDSLYIADLKEHLTAAEQARAQAEQERDKALDSDADSERWEALARSRGRKLDKAEADLEASEHLLASLRTALEQAGEAIHSEYCTSTKCQPPCLAVSASLSTLQARERTTPKDEGLS